MERSQTSVNNSSTCLVVSVCQQFEHSLLYMHDWLEQSNRLLTSVSLSVLHSHSYPPTTSPHSKDRNVRVKTLFTNALVCNKSMKQSKYRPPGWIEYKSGFSTCDEFHCALKDGSYALRRSRWQHNFDDLFFTSQSTVEDPQY